MSRDDSGTAVRSPRAELTRQAIVDAAMRLFLEGGYDKTTMRAIADEAGVSLGNAYYYFGSKEHLLQTFYDRVHTEHAAAAEVVLAREKDFSARLRGLVVAWVEIAEPYHAFAGKFFKNAAEPSSPLSPFSPDSAGTRTASTELFRRAVVARAVPLVDKVARLTRLPVVRGAVKDVVELVDTVRG